MNDTTSPTPWPFDCPVYYRADDFTLRLRSYPEGDGETFATLGKAREWGGSTLHEFGAAAAEAVNSHARLLAERAELVATLRSVVAIADTGGAQGVIDYGNIRKADALLARIDS